MHASSKTALTLTVAAACRHYCHRTGGIVTTVVGALVITNPTPFRRSNPLRKFLPLTGIRRVSDNVPGWHYSRRKDDDDQSVPRDPPPDGRYVKRYGRFRKEDVGNLFRSNDYDPFSERPFSDDDEEDEASYRLARDLAARRGLDVYGGGRPSSGRNAYGGVGTRSVGTMTTVGRVAGARGGGMGGLEPRMTPAAYGGRRDEKPVGGNSGGMSSSSSFPSSSLGRRAALGDDHSPGSDYYDTARGLDNNWKKEAALPSSSSRGETRGGDELYEVIVAREESSRNVDDRWEKKSDNPPPFPPPLSGIRGGVIAVSKNIFYKRKLGNGDDEAAGRDAGTIQPLPPLTVTEASQLWSRKTAQARQGEEASSKNAFRYNVERNKNSTRDDANVVLQRNHDHQQHQQRMQSGKRLERSPSSPASSYPFDRHALSELASNEKGDAEDRSPSLPDGMREPPLTPQYMNFMKQVKTPPPRPTAGKWTPPSSIPPQQQQQPSLQPQPHQQQPTPPLGPMRPAPEFNYGRNAYKSMPLRPLSQPLSELASSMPPPYDMPQGTIGQQRVQQQWPGVGPKQQQKQQQQQQQKQSMRLDTQRPAARPPLGNDLYRPPPTNIYPPPYRSQSPYTTPSTAYDPLRSRPPSLYQGSRLVMTTQQQQQRQVPLSQRAILPNVEQRDRSGIASSKKSIAPLPFAQLNSSEFRQPFVKRSYKQSAGSNVGTVVGSFSQSSDINPGIGQPLQQQQLSTDDRQTSSFKPPPFQRIPQSDFRQPYQGREQPPPSLRDARGEFSEGGIFDSGAPPPEFNEPPPFPDDEGMFLSPFAVPLIMFPPSGRAPLPEERRQAMEEEGVKVPKDPFVERQRRGQWQSASSPSTVNSNNNVKVPKDPFVERRKQQEQQEREQLYPGPQLNELQKTLGYQDIKSSDVGGRMKIPIDPFLERRQQEQQQQQNQPPSMYELISPRQSSMQSNDSSGERPQRQSHQTDRYEPPPPSWQSAKRNYDNKRTPTDPFGESWQRQNQRPSTYDRAPPQQYKAQSYLEEAAKAREDSFGGRSLPQNQRTFMNQPPPPPWRASSRPSPDVGDGNRRSGEVGEDGMTHEEYSSYFGAL